VAEQAIFELRMAGIAVAGNVRPAIVDRVAEAILAEAEAFDADLIVLGRPRGGELATRLLGGVTMRVLRRSSCPVIVAARRPARPSRARARPRDTGRNLIPNEAGITPLRRIFAQLATTCTRQVSPLMVEAARDRGSRLERRAAQGQRQTPHRETLSPLEPGSPVRP
jgi:Universal stress protein family